MNEKISIIVPIYNKAPYLQQCLDSIIHQTYSNLEIILVDDKSTDGSLAICQQYQENDKRIKVINFEQNQGVSIARREGFLVSTGTYIMFLDADDCLDLDALEVLASSLCESVDMIIFGARVLLPDGKQKNDSMPKTITVYSQEETMRQILLQQNISESLCTKLFHRKLFYQDEQQTIFSNHRQREEIHIWPDIISKCNHKIVHIAQIKYNYIKREYSATTARHLSRYDRKLLLNLFNLLETKIEEFSWGLKNELAVYKLYCWTEELNMAQKWHWKNRYPEDYRFIKEQFNHAYKSADLRVVPTKQRLIVILHKFNLLRTIKPILKLRRKIIEKIYKN